MRYGYYPTELPISGEALSLYILLQLRDFPAAAVIQLWYFETFNDWKTLAIISAVELPHIF